MASMSANNDNIGFQPVRAINENQQLSTDGSVIPEQASVPVATMPRSLSILNLINQWQPMGFRIILNLPFVGDDQNFIFAIRNGPFIPLRSDNVYYDILMPTENDPGATSTFTGINSYGYNNMIPVILPSDNGNLYPDRAKPVITMTNYDFPPPISTFAQSFRRWRGDMQYRIRMVAGFATQGYVICTTLKNVFSPIGIYNQFSVAPTLQRQDTSFRPAMMNSYALSDTSMYRHLEITSPFDYPVPYYDQFQWISRRVVPSYQFGLKFDPTKPYEANLALRNRLIQSEPHGDNWLVFGIRGNLESMQVGSQIVFELEYRCAEGFQFADPFLPPRNTSLPFSSMPAGNRVYRVPSNLWNSDGVGTPVPVNPSTTTTTSTQPPVVIMGKRDAPNNPLPGINVGINGDLNVGNVAEGAFVGYRNDNPTDNINVVNVPVGMSSHLTPDERRRHKRDLTPEAWEHLSSLEKLRLQASTYLGQSSRSD